MIFIRKRLPFFLLSILFSTTCLGQKFKDPGEFLSPTHKDSLPKVFLVGTIHFEYYNADTYKVSKDRQIDILSDQKQEELKQLLDYISLFKPNKILVEAKPEWNEMNRYRQYKLKKIPTAKNEIVQIAFALMDRFNLDTIYSIDEGSVADDLVFNKDSSIIKPYIDSIFSDYAFRSNEKYTRFSEYKTKLSTEVSLLDFFKYINSPKVLEASYGGYLVGDFKLGEFRGADALAMYWYDRNLRIFRNIQRLTTSPKDRVLVLFGAGHIEVLDQLFRSSSEYKYIRFNDLRNPG